MLPSESSWTLLFNTEFKQKLAYLTWPEGQFSIVNNQFDFSQAEDALRREKNLEEAKLVVIEQDASLPEARPVSLIICVSQKRLFKDLCLTLLANASLYTNHGSTALAVTYIGYGVKTPTNLGLSSYDIDYRFVICTFFFW